MKVLVTGGAGFIGSHVVDRLIQEGHEVVVVDNLSTGKRKNVPHAANFYKADTQGSRLDRILKKERPTVIFHLAAQMNVRKSTEDPGFDAQVNILGTINLLESAVRYGTRKVIFASSGGAVYGEQQIFPAPESHPTHPLSPYGISKLTGEHYLAYYEHVAGLGYVSLRYGNVYGPRQAPEGEAGVVAIFSQAMLKEGQPLINGNGLQTRDYIFVDDVVSATVGAMQPNIQGTYNVGTGKESSVNEIFHQVKLLTNSECKEIHGPEKRGEQIRSVLNSAKLREALDWEPMVVLDEGLQLTVEFFKGMTKK
ncbi:MAG: GDP-mannose 4,6-dehydratase [Nitrospirae bacterium]|nr:GDP-mannose 4,6-dehydratase [Nitrospirota bacterium]